MKEVIARTEIVIDRLSGRHALAAPATPLMAEINEDHKDDCGCPRWL